jgi:uncharacterized membrane protein
VQGSKPLSSAETAPPRISAIDALRGLALVAMATYHFTWDLDFFGYLEPGTAQTGAMKWYARGIASTFLMLAGFSLVLAHQAGINWPSFRRRFAMVAGAALLITLGTYFAMPRGFIFFGILHQIALGSLIGLAFLRLPPLLTLTAATAMIAAPHFLRSAVFDTPALWWVGLSSFDPPSNDYVPLLPWTGMVLIGIGLAKLASKSGLFETMRRFQAGKTRPGQALSFLGKHSLAFYLIHQPVLLACLWLFSFISPPPPADPIASYQKACLANCALTQSQSFCASFCPCVKTRMQALGQFDKLMSGALDPKSDPNVLNSAQLCSAEAQDNGE